MFYALGWLLAFGSALGLCWLAFKAVEIFAKKFKELDVPTKIVLTPLICVIGFLGIMLLIATFEVLFETIF